MLLCTPAGAAYRSSGLCRIAPVKEVGESRDKLGGCERLLQQDAVRNAVRRPLFGRRAGHVDDGKRRIDFSGALGDFPTVDPAQKVYVRHEGAVIAFFALQQRHRLFARSSYCRSEAALGEGFLDDGLYQRVIFNDQDRNRIFQSSIPQPATDIADIGDLFPANVQKCT